ncbi:DNA-directed RNA polymerases I, II, and III subunit RPABC3 isoform X1 [Acyrthosiphon pisum]|uniref:Uncharacterized protein n=1 Tax=Acyrthosiphon pisum TaxID=7029 RepID=A0A8R2NKF3_ACYPI|nr:DNA-directed RNA polymerases I, II, and III subunit RPABC3 isoform X1 [Acyrthosiphon pisum]
MISHAVERRGGTSRAYIVSYDGHTTRVGPDAAPSPSPRLTCDAPPPQLHASTHAQKYTRARASSARLCNVVVWQRPSAAPRLWLAPTTAPPSPPARPRTCRSFHSSVVCGRDRRSAAAAARAVTRSANSRCSAYGRARVPLHRSPCVLSLFTTRVARAVRVRCSCLSYPFVFVSFTLHDITRPPSTATIITHRVHTFRIRVLEDRTRSVFDMDTRFSPFPNHVNALSGTTLRRPFFYCPTVRHCYTMYRYNAAGIVSPNQYRHTTTAARTTTMTSSSSYCFEFFVYKSIVIYCVSVLIATNSAAYVSFGGLLMRLLGDPNNLHGFEVDQCVYLLMKKLAF